MRRLSLAMLFVVIGASALAQDVAPGRVSLRPDEVDRAASKKMGRVRACYKEALARAPRSYGTIGVGFRIAPDGKVTERFVALSTLADPKLETCIVASFEDVVFPAPGGYGAIARFGVQLKTEDSPEAALRTQEEAYKRAIRDVVVEPVGTARPGATPMPGFEDLQERETFKPLETPTPR